MEKLSQEDKEKLVKDIIILIKSKNIYTDINEKQIDKICNIFKSGDSSKSVQWFNLEALEKYMLENDILTPYDYELFYDLPNKYYPVKLVEGTEEGVYKSIEERKYSTGREILKKYVMQKFEDNKEFFNVTKERYEETIDDLMEEGISKAKPNPNRKMQPRGKRREIHGSKIDAVGEGRTGRLHFLKHLKMNREKIKNMSGEEIKQIDNKIIAKTVEREKIHKAYYKEQSDKQ